jgi:hypothetical protein
MITNEQMIPGRFLRIQIARRLFSAIASCFSQGGVVEVVTHTRATTYKNVTCFKLGKASVYVRSGRSWVCIDFARVVFSGDDNE